MTVSPKVVAAMLFDGTEKSIEGFIPKDLYTINETTSQLTLKKDDTESVIQPGWTVLKDNLGAFFGVEPSVYSLVYEHQLNGN